jgi:NitT/TauT family transport system ATP-binding protein
VKDIVLNGISKAFDGRPVLTDVNLRFPAGSTTCILGPSGCGKTTLLRIIAGLERPDAGSMEGVPDRISFVFQEDRLCEAFSAVSNVRLVSGKELPVKTVTEHLSAIGLGEDLDKPVREFSGGMKRRVAIVRAVCYPAGLLLLDEPFKGLDEKLHGEVIEYIIKHSRERTVICVTHEPEDAERLGGRIIELEKTGG